MTENAYLIWIVAMAIMTIFVLTVGTLAAADMLRRQSPEQRDSTSGDDRAPLPGQATTGPEPKEQSRR